MQKLSPFLWFNDEAEAAAKFYVSVFRKNSKILKIARYTGSGPGPKGSVMTVYFRLAGQDLIALNGGPLFKFSPAFSLVVNCSTFIAKVMGDKDTDKAARVMAAVLRMKKLDLAKLEAAVAAGAPARKRKRWP
jgi:predicted 3-demethylubiquinone-9 3-methyltransferase (glyoxalase superfamily)